MTQIRDLKACSVCGKERMIEAGRTKCSGCRKFEADVNAGRIKGPDYTEVNTQNYKDPMEKVADGFGYYGAITQTNDGEFIQCHICGYYFAALGSHVKWKHEVNTRDYKEKYGLRLTDGLLSPAERTKAQLNYNKYARKTPEEYARMSRAGKVVLNERGYRPGGPTWTAQTRNERGNCREQTLAKIRDLAERMDGAPTTTAFMQDYGQGQASVIEHWFGNWTNALKEAGVSSFREHNQERRAEIARDALGKIQDFYKREGRTPQHSDFKGGNSELPRVALMIQAYGSLNEARREAGVPLLVFRGHGRWQEVKNDSGD